MTTAFQDALAIIRDQQDFLKGCNEAKTIKHAIDPLLLSVGWNIHRHEETFDQYPLPQDKRVDYSLIVEEKSRIFVEAKEWNLSLKDAHRDQLHGYCLLALKNEQMASKGDVPSLGVLTNGRHWRFYVAPDPYNHKLRQMRHEIDIINQDAEWLERYFSEFLARDRLESDEAIRKTLPKARKQHKKFVESIAVMNELDRNWSQLVENPRRQEELLALFAEKREIQADDEHIKRFLASRGKLFNPVSVKEAKLAFTLRSNGVENTIAVHSWPSLKEELCKSLYERHPENFTDVVLNEQEIQHWFCKSNERPKGFKAFGNSGIFIRGKGSKQTINKLCSDLMTAFGCPDDFLHIEEP